MVDRSGYNGVGYDPAYTIPDDELTIADEFPGAKMVLERGLARQERDEAIKRAEKAETEYNKLLEGLRETQRDYADCRDERDQAERDLTVYRDDFDKVCEQRDDYHEERDRLAAELARVQGLYEAERVELRNRLDVTQSVAGSGVWVWLDTPEDDLDSMGSAMVLTMTAGQLRKLLSRSCSKWQRACLSACNRGNEWKKCFNTATQSFISKFEAIGEHIAEAHENLDRIIADRDHLRVELDNQYYWKDSYEAQLEDVGSLNNSCERLYEENIRLKRLYNKAIVQVIRLRNILRADPNGTAKTWDWKHWRASIMKVCLKVEAERDDLLEKLEKANKEMSSYDKEWRDMFYILGPLLQELRIYQSDIVYEGGIGLSGYVKEIMDDAEIVYKNIVEEALKRHKANNKLVKK